MVASASEVSSGRLAGTDFWYLELLMESVWLYEFCFRTFWIVFSLYFPFSLFAKHSPLAPTRPGSFPFSVGFTLVATVLCKSSWEKKRTTTTQSLAFPCWLDSWPCRAPVNLLLFSPVVSRALLILSRQIPTHQAQAKARWFPEGLPGTSSS